MFNKHVVAVSYAFLRRNLSSLSSVTRDLNYAECTKKDILFFESILSHNNVQQTQLDGYNTDFMKWYKGNSQCVLSPENETQLSEILRYCYHRRLAVVPQSGNTGLVGASVPVFDEIIISMKKFNKQFHLDSISGILKCDSGFILEELDSKLASDDLMMPLDLGSKGSCLIGGNVATNAGGIRLIHFGSLQANVLGLRVCLPDENGTIVEFGTGLRKDNSDLHTVNLFVGSEGHLGIITEVTILTYNRPKSVHSLLLSVETSAKCCEVLKCARKMLREILFCFEFMDSETIRCIEENTSLRNPLASDKSTKFFLLIETSGSSKESDSARVEQFFSHCLNIGLICDGILANNAKESNHLWKLRENASTALLKDGYVYKHDFSLPLSHYFSLLEVVRSRLGSIKLADLIRVTGFGHLGDGNVHFNVTAKKRSEQIENLLYPFVYEYVVNHGGNISAEHGIGRIKLPQYKKYCAPKKLEINNKIKRIFDPREILSPYKFISS